MENNFYCQNCGAFLRYSGKAYGTNLRFFTCVNEEEFHLNINPGCGNSMWIDVIKRIDTYGYKYE